MFENQIMITPTDDLVTVNGHPTRLWDGVTVDGRRCHVFVSLIAFPTDQEPAIVEDSLLRVYPRVVD